MKKSFLLKNSHLWILRWENLFVSFANALLFIKKCKENNFNIIGSEGFIVSKKGECIPLWNIVLDFHYNETNEINFSAEKRYNQAMKNLKNKTFFTRALEEYYRITKDLLYLHALREIDNPDYFEWLRLDFVIKK